MPILLTTFGLLLLLALVGVSQVTNCKNSSLLTAVAQFQAATMRLDLTDNIKKHTQDLDRIQRPKKDQDLFSPTAKRTRQQEALTSDNKLLDAELNSKKQQGKRTSFLHVDTLFCEDDPNIGEGRGKACFLLLEAYIKELYQGQHFYEYAKEIHPDLEDRLIKEWIREAGELRKLDPNEGKLKRAEELAKLPLDDPYLKYMKANMFSGMSLKDRIRRTKRESGRHSNNDSDSYYSLSECVSIRKSPHIMSVWLAPRPLLMALFQNKEIVNDLLAWRKEAYYEIDRDKSILTIDSKSRECKDRFSGSIFFSIDAQFIDFSVSHNSVALTE